MRKPIPHSTLLGRPCFRNAGLNSHPGSETLRDAHAFRSYCAPLKQIEWVVYAKPPFTGPQQVLDYVGRYTHRVAISNNRLLDVEQDGIGSLRNYVLFWAFCVRSPFR